MGKWPWWMWVVASVFGLWIGWRLTSVVQSLIKAGQIDRETYQKLRATYSRRTVLWLYYGPYGGAVIVAAILAVVAYKYVGLAWLPGRR